MAGPSEPEHAGGGEPQKHRDGLRYRGQEVHGGRDVACDALAVGKGEVLRHKLADNERDIGDAGDDDSRRGGLRMAADERNAVKQFGELRRQGELAVGAGQDRHNGNADLDGGQEAGGIAVQRQSGRRAAAAVGRHLLQPRWPRRHNRQLRHDEEAVERDQQ